MNKNVPRLFRRRFIPNEKVFLKDDEIIELNNDIIITKWKVLKKRSDFSSGVSCYFLKDNIKVSKFIDENNNLLYWYCDIIDWEYDKVDNVYIFNDLLIDIIVYKDGFVKVVDLGEVSSALEKGFIDVGLAKKALNTADSLLNVIYNGKFDLYINYILDI